MTGFDLSHIVVSVAAALVIGGAVLVYVRSRLGELERSHIEQARVLRTFIAQQANALKPLEAPSAEVASAPSPVVESPRERIMVSDDGSDSEEASDCSSEYESDSMTECSIHELQNVEGTVADEANNAHTRIVELSPQDTMMDAVSQPEEQEYHKMRVDALRSMALERGLVESTDAAKKLKKPSLVSLLVGEVEVSKGE